MTVLKSISTQTLPFRQDHFFIWSSWMSVATQAGCFIILLLRWSKLPPLIPLFYSLPWGIDQLSSPVGLLFLVGSISIFFIINTLWALFLFTRSKFLSHMLLITTAIITIITALTLVQIIFLVT